MDVDVLKSPTAFLQRMMGEFPLAPVLKDFEDWWVDEGIAISTQVDRLGTPWVRMFDVLGNDGR